MFASREVAEERQMKAAENWRKAKGQLRVYGFGCLVVLLIAALFMAYLAGYVASAVRKECLSPTHVSTP